MKRDLNKLDPSEISVLKELVREKIDELDKRLSKNIDVMLPNNDGEIAEDNKEKLRHWYEDRNLRNFYITLEDRLGWMD
jgi:hypothetical protein